MKRYYIAKARPTQRDVHIDRPLTNLSIAYANAAYIAQGVFPRVPVDKQSDFYWIFPKEYWFRRRAKPRTPGTRAQRGDYAITTGSYLCLPYALATAVPDEVRENADAPLQPDVQGTNFVTDGLMLDMEIRVATVVTTTTNWIYSSSPATQWNNNNSDPWGDIEGALDSVIQQIGREPNTLVLGYPVWSKLKNHPDLLDRIKYTRPQGRVEPGDLRSWFGFENVLIGHALYDTSLEGQSASQTFIWGKNAWVGYVANNPALMEPSAGYVFEWMNRKVELFREEQEHQDVISAEHHTDERICASDAGALIPSAVA